MPRTSVAVVARAHHRKIPMPCVFSTWTKPGLAEVPTMACRMMWFFFFQAEDGIRDVAVTGVQTCALPIYLYNDILTSPEAKKLDANGIFEKIAIRDVQDACDIFKPVYAETKRRDGYVSLEDRKSVV